MAPRPLDPTRLARLRARILALGAAAGAVGAAAAIEACNRNTAPNTPEPEHINAPQQPRHTVNEPAPPRDFAPNVPEPTRPPPAAPDASPAAPPQGPTPNEPATNAPRGQR